MNINKIKTFQIFLTLSVLAMSGIAWSDGTERLGPATIPIASGSGIATAGVGLLDGQPGVISVDVPIGVSVEQVLLYWSGEVVPPAAASDTIDVDGNAVTGSFIGGFDSTGITKTRQWAAYRADITGLNLVSPGVSNLEVSGLNFNYQNVNNGAGVVVIFDDGSAALLDLRDGNDHAFIGQLVPLDATVEQTFTFPPSSVDRFAQIDMFYSSISGTYSGGGFRPSAFDVTVSGVTTEYNNLLDSNNGAEWDTVTLQVDVPAGATDVTVQAFSIDRLGIGGTPASFDWLFASLVVKPDTASLGDRVWEDLDRDGIQDAGEPGIDGVRVLLTNCGDSANPLNVLDTMVTAGGSYLFNGLDAGTYCVEFDKPSAEEALNCFADFSAMDAGGNDSIDSDADPITGKTAPIDLASGEENLTVDAGLNCPAERVSLGDYVWEDLNANGIQDDGGTGLLNVFVTLLSPGNDGQCGIVNGINDDVSIETTTTNTVGFYEFADLETGAYCVEFDQASAANALDCNAVNGGSIAFSPANEGGNDTLDSNAGTDGYTSVINLSEDDPTIDAGLYCPAKLGDFVWNDLDRDGIQEDGEPGLNDVTVILLACVDGLPTDTVIGTTVTATDADTGLAGSYMFNPLMPGDYAVQFVAPTDYLFSEKDAPDATNTADDLDSDANTANGKTVCTSLESNEFDDTWDAGLHEAPLSGLGDFVWHDLNANGMQDPDEPGVERAMVTLLLPGNDGNCATGDEIDIGLTAITPSNGMYGFENLFEGRYCVAFDISDVKLDCSFGDGPVFTTANEGDDAADSDADRDTGKTGDIDLGFMDFDETIDAGIYCPGKLGDTVWKDENGNGIQDDGATGVSGVSVELYECAANGEKTPTGIMQMTDGMGMYMFSDLMPGSYAVKFIEPDNFDFTLLNEGSDNTVDSDADPATGITTECADVVSNEFNNTLDAGLIDPPPCGLGLAKTCEVITPPAPPLEECDGKIQSFTMIWTGGPISIDGIGYSNYPVEYDQEVTFSAPAGGWDENNNYLSISGDPDGVESVFHVSCSDNSMDGETDDAAYPSDCDRPNGDGKDDDADLINKWLFEGLVDNSGQVVDCTAAVTVPTSSCEFSATTASCDTLPEKPTMFSFQYTGGGCAAADNSQGSKFDCSGAISANSTVTLMTSAGETIEDVKPGDLVTIEKDGSETTITLDDGPSGIGIETIVFHTSCSAPLITGEVFGSLTLTALDGQGSGREVLYSYLVTNGGSNAITGISVTDSVFGPIGTVSSLNPGDSETLTAMSFVSETTENTATATGDLGSCVSNEATAIVTVTPPPPCTVSVAFKELKDDAIKYTVTNTGTSAATLDVFMLEFPSAYEAIKEVKLDGAIYKSGDSSLVIESGDTIGSGDWTQSDVSKRVLDPGESRTLEIKFTKKANGSSSDFNGTVTFNDGDCMILL